MPESISAGAILAFLIKKHAPCPMLTNRGALAPLSMNFGLMINNRGNCARIVRFYDCHEYTNDYNLISSSEMPTLYAVSRC